MGGIFPNVEIENFKQGILTEKKEDKEIKSTPLFDFESNEFVLKDGDVVMLHGKDSVAMWIIKALMTNIGKAFIYKRDDDIREYGTYIKDIFYGKVQLDYYVEAEMTRDIQECLSFNKHIQNVTNFKYSRDGITLNISFDVYLFNGEKIELGGYFLDGKFTIRYT